MQVSASSCWLEPLNDLGTIPGEEALLEQFQAEDRSRFAAIDAVSHYHSLQIRDFLRAIRQGHSR